MGSAYSVRNLISARVNTEIVASPGRQVLLQTFHTWTVEDVKDVLHKLDETSAVKWPTLFKALEDTQNKNNKRIYLDQRKNFHTSCMEYAMVAPEKEGEERAVENSSVCSPVFFGYSLKRFAQQCEEQEVKEAKSLEALAMTDHEQDEMEAEADRLRKEHSRLIQSRKTKRETSLKAVQRERDQWLSEKKREESAAKTSMSEQEFKHFSRELADEIAAWKAKCAEADKVSEAAFVAEETAENEKASSALRGIEMKIQNLSRDRDFPNGEKLLKQNRKAVEELESKLSSLRAEMQSKQEELDQAKEQAGDKADKQPHRGMIVVAEGEVKKAQREIIESENALVEQELLCRQAEELCEREARYLPLFMALVQDDVNAGSNYGTVDVSSLVLLILACCKSDLMQKSALAFEIGANSDSNEAMSRSQLRTLIFKFVRSLEKLGGCLANKSCFGEFLHGMVDRVFLETRQNDQLVKFEFQAWVVHTVSASKDLSLLFAVPWKFAGMSDFGLQKLSAGRQYELGFKSLEKLNTAVDHIWCTYREELSLKRKLAIHERALAMGGNDPLKPDYSRFFAKNKQKLQSNAVPLLHGAYGNVVYQRAALMSQMATRVQSCWRARVGRSKAIFLVQKNAFFALWQQSLEEARTNVEQTFATREGATGVARMKWDASVRMRQGKLLSLGKKLSRDEVVELLKEEDVAVAQDLVNKDFSSMAVTRGFQEKDDNIMVEDHRDEEIDAKNPNPLKLMYSERLKQSRRAESALRKQTRAEFIVKRQLEKAGFDVENPETFKMDLTESNEEAPKLSQTEPQARSLHEQALLKGASELDLEERQCLQYLGADLNLLYRVGTNREEDSLQLELGNPDPCFDDYIMRLKAIHDTLTPQKASELALELPSKRLLMRYVERFKCSPAQDLQADLIEHFRILPRGAPAIAQRLRAICSQDVETQCFVLLANKLLKKLRLNSAAPLPLLDGLQDIPSPTTGQRRSAVKKLPVDFDQVPLDETKRRVNKVLGIQRKVEALRQEMDAAQRELEVARQNEAISYGQVIQHRKDAGMAEDFDTFRHDMRIQSRAGLFRDKKLIGDWYAQLAMPRVRSIEAGKHMDWLGRLLALEPITTTSEESHLLEVRALLDDFLSTARHYGRIIILEKHLAVDQKTIQPVRSRTTDCGAGMERLYWKVCNIRFKFTTDDDGLCNGSDEFAAKLYGHALRNARAYANCDMSTVYCPLEAVVDFAGFRLHASCDMGTEKIRFDSSGNLKSRDAELVYGSPDRGVTIKNEDSLLDRKLKEAASQLNLAVHDVRGTNDMLPKSMATSADLLAHKSQDGQVGFCLTNFRRCFPPEHPAATPHLPSAPRGHSIFWRQLRPEFVKRYPARLSPDALSLFAKDCQDMHEHNAEVYNATKMLIETAIPAFAEELSLKRPQEVISLNVSLEFHKRGLNIRHIGLLRSFFWFRVAGYMSVTFKKPSIRSTEPLTDEIQPGHFLRIKNQLFKVSGEGFEASSHHCSLEVSPDFSAQDQVVSAGIVERSGNSLEVRSTLLVEILSRTLKNMLRFISRKTSGLFAGPSELALSICQAEFINLVIGATEGTDKFWEKYVPENAARRYGNLCLSVQERRNLFNHVVQHSLMLKVLERLAEMSGMVINENCWMRLRESFGAEISTPRYILPVTSADVTPRCRVKHNFLYYDASLGLALAAKAERLLTTTYQDLVLSSKPFGYWPLTQKKGAVIATNMGSTGLKYSGKVVNCISGAPGRVKNVWPDTATRFPKHLKEFTSYEAELVQRNEEDARVDDVVISDHTVVEVNRAVPASCAKVDISFSEQLVPQGQHQPFSVDCWACCEGANGRARTILMSGRYCLGISREDQLEFTIFDSVLAVAVNLTARELRVEHGKWIYLAGTFDGHMARFYVDAVLQAEANVPACAHRSFNRRRIRIVEAELKRKEQERLERESAERFVRDETDRYFSTKAGKLELNSMIKHAIAKTNAKLKLQKEKAKILGVKPLSQGEAKSLVLREYVTKKLMEYEEKITERHEKLRVANTEQENRLLLRAKENAASHLRFGASVSKVRKSEGREFFIGTLQHVSVAPVELNRDIITQRFVTGGFTSAGAAGLVLKEALVVLERAMVDCHSDPTVLSTYAKVLSKLYLNQDHGGEAGVVRVEAAIDAFKSMRNAELIAEILQVLPDGPTYASLAQQCWAAIQFVSPTYFASGNPVQRKERLLELEMVPDRFSLTRCNTEDASRKFIMCAADMYRFVFHHLPEIYGADAGDMSWVSTLPSAGLVCHLVNKIKGSIRYCKRRCHHNQLLRDRGLSPLEEDVTPLEHMEQELQELFVPAGAMVRLEDLIQLAKNLPLLSLFDLSAANASKAVPVDLCRYFEQTKFLHEVVLATCASVDDKVIECLGKNCVGLRKVDLSRCSNVTDNGLIPLVNGCQKLTHVRIEHCERLTDLSLALIAHKLTKLNTLSVAWCGQMTDKGFAEFGQTCAAKENVKHLILSGCSKLADEGLVCLATGLTKLYTLFIDFCYRLTADGIRKLVHRLWELQKLSMADVHQVLDTSFVFDLVGDGRGLAKENMLTKLHTIDLSDCNNITDHTIELLASRNDSLVDLSLAGCSLLTDRSIRSLTLCPITGEARGELLVRLDLSYCSSITPVAVDLISERCSRLQEISLKGLARLSAKKVGLLCKRCPGIQALSLAHCKRVDDETIKCIVRELWLEELDVSYCGKITDDALASIAQGCGGLLRLDVSWCRKITELGLEDVVSSCSWLQELRLTGCDSISDQMLNALQSRHGNLTVHR